MGRHARLTFEVPGGSGERIGAGFKVRAGYFRVQFPHRSERGKYVEASTGVEVPKGWTPRKSLPPEFHTAAAKAIARHYAPTLPPDPRRVTWEVVVERLSAGWGRRSKSLETYLSIIRVLRSHLPESRGPGDITPATAERFLTEYGSGTYKRSKKSDARGYRRSPKTVENAARRLSGLWNRLGKMKLAEGNPWESVERPSVPTKLVKIPAEATVEAFARWLRDRYPEWELPSLFVTVKALAGCRTFDLCQARSGLLRDGTLTIDPEQDKTNRQRAIPLPPDLFAKLDRIKGPTYLWESYAEGARKYRPGSRNRDDFSPRTLFWCINNIFREWNEAHPGKKLCPHDLRKRAITLTAAATGSIDRTAQAIGIDPGTARRYYVEAQKAFDGQELLRKMAEVLRPK